MDKEIIKIEPLKRFCMTIGNIPSSYVDSLSYEEQIMWISNYLETVIIKAINNNADILIELKYIVDHFESQYDELNDKINNLRIEVNRLLTEEKAYVDSELNRFYNLILSLNTEFRREIENFVTIRINEMNERIDEIELGNIDAYNPTTGRIENINKVLNDIYDSVRYDAITVGEFEALQLTATGFDSKQITAYNFDNNGKSILTQ